jgi:dienelactone hydrolase
MNRTEILRHLFAGHDVLAWDPRGTAESTGEASEGGYYLDVDVVYHYAVANGYRPEKIYAFGFCKGAACAAHLKKKYHHLGLNAVLSNPYTSMKGVVENYGWLGRLASRFGLKAIQSTDPAITHRVEQDYFDNVNKLRNLPHSNGKLIVIHTKTDNMMPYASAERLFDAFNYAGPIFEIVHFHPDPKANGHMLPPDETPYVQRRLYHLIR